MPTANFVMQEKGGVGKTPFALNLSSFLRASGRPHCYIDADIRASFSDRYFPDVITPEIDESQLAAGCSEAGVIVERLIAGEDLVVDTGSNTCRFFNNFFLVLDFAGRVAQGQFRVNIFVPILSTMETQYYAQRVADLFPWATVYHVHMQLGLNYSRDVYPPHDPAKVIVFPYLPSREDPLKPGIREKLRARMKTLDQALAEGLFPEFMEREVVAGARNKLYAQFTKIQEQLTK